MKSHKWRVGVLAIGVTVAVLLPTAAYADSPLADDTLVAGSGANTYTFSTSTPYWSVVAVQPASGDIDLRLADANSQQLAASTLGTGKTDFVAVNSNGGFRPYGGYRATTNVFLGSSAFWVQQIQGHLITTLPMPANDGVSGASDPDIAFATLFEAKVVSISDIYLSAGQKFWATSTTAANHLFLMESNPGDSATFVRSRSAANASTSHAAVDGCTLYTATYSGWHALVVIGDVAPVVPGNAGLGYALHRWSPAKPSTCPIKNFPGPTPA